MQVSLFQYCPLTNSFLSHFSFNLRDISCSVAISRVQRISLKVFFAHCFMGESFLPIGPGEFLSSEGTWMIKYSEVFLISSPNLEIRWFNAAAYLE